MKAMNLNHHGKPTSALTRFAALILAAALLAGCGSKMSGIYKATDENSAYTQLNFTSATKVELINPINVIEATYVVEDGKVKITSAGQTQVFTLGKDGSLDGGLLMGKYSKQ